MVDYVTVQEPIQWNFYEYKLRVNFTSFQKWIQSTTFLLNYLQELFLKYE